MSDRVLLVVAEDAVSGSPVAGALNVIGAGEYAPRRPSILAPKPTQSRGTRLRRRRAAPCAAVFFSKRAQ